MPGLFGSPPSVKSVPITLQPSLNTQQQGAQGTLLGALQNGQNPTSAFQGINYPLNVNLSGLQNTSLQALQDLIGGSKTAAQGGQNLQGQAQNTLTNVMNSSPQDLTSYFKTNIFDPLNDTFQNTTLPSIASFFGGSLGGPQSAAAATAVGDASKSFEQTLASTQGQLAYNTAEQNIANKLSAANQVPTLANEGLQQLISILGGGSVDTQNQQQNVQNQLSGTNQTNQTIQQQLLDLIAYLNVQTQTPANQAVSSSGSTGLLGGVLGGLAGNAGLGSALGALLL